MTMVWRVITVPQSELTLLVPGDTNDPDNVFRLDAETLLPLARTLGSPVVISQRRVRSDENKVRVDVEKPSRTGSPKLLATTLITGDLAQLFWPSSSIGLLWNRKQTDTVNGRLEQNKDADLLRKIEEEIPKMAPGLRKEMEIALAHHRRAEQQRALANRPQIRDKHHEANGYACDEFDWKDKNTSLRACVSTNPALAEEATTLGVAAMFWARAERAAGHAGNERWELFDKDELTKFSGFGLAVRVQRLENGVYRLEDLLTLHGDDIEPEVFQAPARQWVDPLAD